MSRSRASPRRRMPHRYDRGPRRLFSRPDRTIGGRRAAPPYRPSWFGSNGRSWYDVTMSPERIEMSQFTVYLLYIHYLNHHHSICSLFMIINLVVNSVSLLWISPRYREKFLLLNMEQVTRIRHHPCVDSFMDHQAPFTFV